MQLRMQSSDLVEELRDELVKRAELSGSLTSPDVLEISRILDELIVRIQEHQITGNGPTGSGSFPVRSVVA